LTVEDLDRVHAIEVSASPDPWSRNLFADELAGDRDDRRWLVAEPTDRTGASSDLVGFGGVMVIADEAHIMNVAVEPKHRRQGIAARLVARLLLDVADGGASAATLEVRAGNDPAAGLYRRFGFVEAGRRPRYYPDGEDAIIMWLHRLQDQGVRSVLEQAVDGRAPVSGGELR
jgi:ribosomal-protein-alanine N-acetyltransferase